MATSLGPGSLAFLLTSSASPWLVAHTLNAHPQRKAAPWGSQHQHPGGRLTAPCRCLTDPSDICPGPDSGLPPTQPSHLKGKSLLSTAEVVKPALVWLLSLSSS